MVKNMDKKNIIYLTLIIGTIITIGIYQFGNSDKVMTAYPFPHYLKKYQVGLPVKSPLSVVYRCPLTVNV